MLIVINLLTIYIFLKIYFLDTEEYALVTGNPHPEVLTNVKL